MAHSPAGPQAPDPTAPPLTPRRPRTALELAIIVIGGWVITTIGQGLLNTALPNQTGTAIALGGVLSTAWYLLLAYEGYYWVMARRPPRDAGPLPSALTFPDRPIFGIVSIASIVLVWIWAWVVSSSPKGSGESAQIGLFAAGVVCLGGLIVALLSGIASVARRERRWAGMTGLVATLATAAAFYYMLAAL